MSMHVFVVISNDLKDNLIKDNFILRKSIDICYKIISVTPLFSSYRNNSYR